MISAVLLLTVGLIDIAVELLNSGAEQQGKRPRRRIWLAASAPVLVPVIGLSVLGTPLFSAILIGLIGAAWLFAEWLYLSESRNRLLLTVAVLLIPTTALAVSFELGSGSAARAAADLSSLGASLHLIAPSPVLLPLAAAFLVLTSTANIVCRAAVNRAAMSDERGDAVGARGRRWRISVGSRELASVDEPLVPSTSATASPSALRGGRLIGPLERTIIVALALIGAEAVIVGFIAAKGIVRFPEISADGRGGGKAEEFLVGSLVSWLIAGAAAAYIWILQKGL